MYFQQGGEKQEKSVMNEQAFCFILYDLSGCGYFLDGEIFDGEIDKF